MAGSGITRSETNENVYKFSIPFASTVTFQTSYFIRVCKTWNILGCDLRHRDIGLNTFKSKLKTYYEHALSKIYNCDDHARGSPYVLNVEGRGPWTVFEDVASCMNVMFCCMLCFVMRIVSCQLFIRVFNININVI